jgi:hypothetical protein
MKSKKNPQRKTGIERHDINVIKLKARDRATLQTMAKRYKVDDLVDFLEGYRHARARTERRCSFF